MQRSWWGPGFRPPPISEQLPTEGVVTLRCYSWRAAIPAEMVVSPGMHTWRRSCDIWPTSSADSPDDPKAEPAF